jgi:hypothetical protein
LLDQTQFVGVGDTAGKDESVELFGLRVAHGLVRIEGVALVDVAVDRLHGVPLRSEQDRLAACVLDRPPWAGQLDLLDAVVRDQEGNALV